MAKQLPPGQFETEKWPILHEGDVYPFDESTWDFRLFGDVKEEVSLSYQQVMKLPKTISTIDMHCVTTWSKFDTTFEGIAFREFLRFVELDSDVKYVKIYDYLNQDRFGYSANLPLEVPMGDDALFVYRWKDKHRDWQDIPQNMAIRSALWKGAKWASEIRFMKKDEPGYWEQRGYSMNSNPFKEERFADR